MATHNPVRVAPFNVHQGEHTVDLLLELPQDFMRLAVDGREDRGPCVDDSEENVIVDSIREIEFVGAGVQKLTNAKWRVLLRTLKRLQSADTTLQLLIALLDVRGLWAAMTVQRLRLLVDMALQHADPVNRYLQTTLNRWTTILVPVVNLNVVVDAKSVESIAGLWPQSNLKDRQQLDRLCSQRDFFPSLTDSRDRSALRDALLSLDGRVLTFEMLLTHELPLLRQAWVCVPSVITRSDGPRIFNGRYWQEWAPRFDTLCTKLHKSHADKTTRMVSSRNVYQSQQMFFTSCRWCDDVGQRRGLWRFHGDLAPYFISPATQSPDTPDPRDLPLQGLIFDFLRCFFGTA